MSSEVEQVTQVVLEVARNAREEIGSEVESAYTQGVKWPIQCEIGPGLEGAIACESSVGYVNGSRGNLIYRGYDIFQLAAHSTFEEVSFLLLHGHLPSKEEMKGFDSRLKRYRNVPKTLRMLMGFPVENMNVMGALRLGTNLMRQEFTCYDKEEGKPAIENAISADEDSIAMETPPRGDKEAIYTFQPEEMKRPSLLPLGPDEDPCNMDPCHHIIAGVSTIAAAISRVRQGRLPIEPDPSLGHAANYLYMLTGRRPTPVEERIMDIALILHADHGMNASTFATMVVASTLSDIYLSVGSGIAALNGPLHGGANERVVEQLESIGSASAVPAWYEAATARGEKIMGFGHRVYKKYDPRARVLGPLARFLSSQDTRTTNLLATAKALEDAVVAKLGDSKGVYPNVDFYSGLVYACLGIPTDMFTATFAVSRAAGWTSRVNEYMQHNRIFRPRAVYTGQFDLEYVPIQGR